MLLRTMKSMSVVTEVSWLLDPRLDASQEPSSAEPSVLPKSTFIDGGA